MSATACTTCHLALTVDQHTDLLTCVPCESTCIVCGGALVLRSPRRPRGKDKDAKAKGVKVMACETCDEDEFRTRPGVDW